MKKRNYIWVLLLTLLSALTIMAEPNEPQTDLFEMSLEELMEIDVTGQWPIAIAVERDEPQTDLFEMSLEELMEVKVTG